MQFDLDRLDPAERYRLLTASIVPRPIAWVTTMDGTGRINAAPFSSFNMMGHTPPVLAIGMQPRLDCTPKDSWANIAATGELVINLVRFADLHAMNATAFDYPAGIDELALTGVATLPSARVRPPRIASAPASFECRVLQLVEPGPQLSIVLAEVLAIHVADDCVADAPRCHLVTPALDAVGRMHGPGWYVRCGELIQVAPP